MRRRAPRRYSTTMRALRATPAGHAYDGLVHDFVHETAWKRQAARDGARHQIQSRGHLPGWHTFQRPSDTPETCVARLTTQRRSVFDGQQDPRVAHGRGRARHVPDQAVACGGERSLMGTPTGRLTRTIVVKAVPEKYSLAIGQPAPRCSGG